MIENDSSNSEDQVKIVHEQREAVKFFLQGALIALCKNMGKEKRFSLWTMIDKEDLKSTPLSCLYEFHDGDLDMAAQSCGRILKAVIQEDRRKFEIIKNISPNEYKLQ